MDLPLKIIKIALAWPRAFFVDFSKVLMAVFKVIFFFSACPLLYLLAIRLARKFFALIVRWIL